MVKIDSSVFIQIVNFLFLIWVSNNILYKPIRNILVKRKEKITNLEHRIEILNKDAKDKNEAFEQGIKVARSKGIKEKGMALAEASDKEKKIIENINNKAQADLVKVREKIKKEAVAVSKSLQQEVDTFAAAIGKKILGRVI